MEKPRPQLPAKPRIAAKPKRKPPAPPPPPKPSKPTSTLTLSSPSPEQLSSPNGDASLRDSPCVDAQQENHSPSVQNGAAEQNDCIDDKDVSEKIIKSPDAETPLDRAQPPPLPSSPPPTQRKPPFSPSSSISSPPSSSTSSAQANPENDPTVISPDIAIVTAPTESSSSTSISASPSTSNLQVATPSPPTSKRSPLAGKAPPPVSPKPKAITHSSPAKVDNSNNTIEDKVPRSSLASDADKVNEEIENTDSHTSASKTDDNDETKCIDPHTSPSKSKSDNVNAEPESKLGSSISNENDSNPNESKVPNAAPVSNSQSHVTATNEDLNKPPRKVPPKKPVKPPARPMSPPSRPTPPPKRAPPPPKRPSVPVAVPVTSPSPPVPQVTAPQSSSTSCPTTAATTPGDGDPVTSDKPRETQTESSPQKQKPSVPPPLPSAPPPLPKNPPRGGVPRKPRSQQSFSKTSQKESPAVEKDKPDQSIEEAKNASGVATSPQDGENKGSKDGGETKSLAENKDKVCEETKQACGNSDQAQKSTEEVDGGKSDSDAPALRKKFVRQANTEESDLRKSDLKQESLPRPRPRKRSSLPSLPKSNDQVGDQGLPQVEKPKEKQEESKPAPDSSGSAPVVARKPVSLKIHPELDYAEVYCGHSDEEDQDLAAKPPASVDVSPKSQPSQSITNNSSAISDKGQVAESSDSHADGININNNNNNNADDDVSRLSLRLSQEPDSTCEMLKEIEELLKSKLGDFDKDLDSTAPLSDSEGKNTSVEAGDLTKSRANSSASSSPARPPRPKRQASISRLRGSIESLDRASVDSTSVSTECLPTATGQSSGKKVIPPKPKRTTLPHINRSRSDVTGMKGVADSHDDDLSEAVKDQEEEDSTKPYLPPRLESLRRSDSFNNNQVPPPLPPRNKPRSTSMNETGRTMSSLSLASQASTSTLDTAGSPAPSASAQSVAKSETPQDSKNVASPSGTKNTPTPKSSQKRTSRATAKPRPARKAPPPPPGPPKRAATFAPGDKTPSGSDKSEDSSGGTTAAGKADQRRASLSPHQPTVKKTLSMVQRRWSKSPGKDHDYHEIPDVSIPADPVLRDKASKKDVSPPPPQLPPRSSRSSSRVADDIPQPATADTTDTQESQSAADTLNDGPEGTKDEESKTKSGGNSGQEVVSPEEQRLKAKKAKAALIQKVSQDLGLPASAAPADPTSGALHLVNSTFEAGDQDISSTVDEDCNKNKNEDVEHVARQKSVSDASSSSPSTPRKDRPDSIVSHQSTASDPEGEGHLVDEASSESESDEDGPEEIYAQRKALKVFYIAEEIMSSEKSFVDVLKLLNIDFRKHISSATEKQGQPVIPTETLNKILDYLPQLQNFNEELLKDLTERINNWEKNKRLSDIFVKKGPFLKLYSSYIRNFENATAILDDARKKNPAFAAALKEFEMSPRCASLALKHYMLKPIQRIPQYRLLLQDYMKQLYTDSPDYKDTTTALNIVSEVADHANESMRHGDNVQKLLEIQRSLIGQFEVIEPGRELIKKGELQKLSRKEMQPRMFFLFSDVLLYTTPATGGYKVNNVLPLSGMKIVRPKLEDYKFEFNILSTQRSFTVQASTSQEKEDWLTALQEAIDENAKRFHTFESVKHGQTSLHDKDFVLGAKAPLWVPDARVTMCMLCLTEFTITWRRHHCRSCGRVICARCSDNKAPLRYMKYQPARVCDECFEKLQEEMKNELSRSHGESSTGRPSISEEESSTSVSDSVGEERAEGGEGSDVAAKKDDGGLSLTSLMSRFQKLRFTSKDKRKANNYRPSVLKEVHANDEGSDMSGYLNIYKSRKWKKLWFVVKGKVLYTYKASEDMAAIESMPLLGYEVTRFNTWFEGAEPDLLFELTHQNTQPLVTRKGGEALSPKVVPGTEKTTQRLIFRTDSSMATTKWVTVLREASLT